MSALAKIHIGKKQLGLTDADYRSLLAGATGKTSAAAMTNSEHQAVLEVMGKLGFKPQLARAKRSAYAHVRKVFALWGSMGREGLLRSPSRAALQAFCQRQTGTENPEWLSPEQASKVIEGLKAIESRARASQQPVDA
jgi:phage gp16-like protein